MVVISFSFVLHPPLFLKQNDSDGGTEKCENFIGCQRPIDSEKFSRGQLFVWLLTSLSIMHILARTRSVNEIHSSKRQKVTVHMYEY